MKNIAIILFFFFSSCFCYSQKIIFLHHSTGAGVYTGGKVAEWINNYNSEHATNYLIFERSYPNAPYEWANYPFDYWNLWINRQCDNSGTNIACLDQLCSDFDVIIFKHCFPGAAISTDIPSPTVNSNVKCLANYKLQYRTLLNLMDSYPNKKFIVWTLAPLHRLATSAESAARAREFVYWVKNTWLIEDDNAHPNVFIFDFFGLAAELNNSPVNGQVNCLRYDYEGSHTENDSHPNTLANQTIGPIFAQFIVNVVEQNVNVPITSITVTGAGGISYINTENGSLQLNAAILPANASKSTLTWSIQNGTGAATISASGLVTAVSNGTVTARATAQDGSEVFGNFLITISNQVVLVTNISVSGTGGISSIPFNNGTLQLNADILPANATNKNVTWTIQNGTGEATISASGLVTAVSSGIVTARATALDGSEIHGDFAITILDQSVKVESITIYADGFKTYVTLNDSLLMKSYVFPENASNKEVIWSVNNSSGKASITENGVLKPISVGYVTIKATAKDESGTYGIVNISIQETTDIFISEEMKILSIFSSYIMIYIKNPEIWMNIRLLDESGRILQEEKINKNYLYIDKENLLEGIYFVQFLFKNGSVQTLKFIK
jgi:uncharacterized protein YjdB